MKPKGLIPRMMAWSDRHPRKAAFLLSLALHVNSIQNGIVWGDRASVTYNKDVAEWTRLPEPRLLGPAHGRAGLAQVLAAARDVVV